MLTNFRHLNLGVWKSRVSVRVSVGVRPTEI